MNTRNAIEETMGIVSSRLQIAKNIGRDTFYSSSLGYDHVREIFIKICSDSTMSEGKLSRWLGWMQCSVVSWGIMTLEEAKEINRRNQ